MKRKSETVLENEIWLVFFSFAKWAISDWKTMYLQGEQDQTFAFWMLITFEAFGLEKSFFSEKGLFLQYILIFEEKNIWVSGGFEPLTLPFGVDFV